jgi:hypothetical protein
MSKFQRIILVTLKIEANNSKDADEAQKDLAGMIRDLESCSIGEFSYNCETKSAEIIPNYKRKLLV